MHRRSLRQVTVALFLWPLLALAVVATLAQIAEAVRNSPNSSQWLRDNADAVARLAVNVESRGETTAYNGSCCYGVLQMNQANIRQFARVEPAVYRTWSLQQQVDAWSALTSPLVNTGVVRQLTGMGTFDGRPVDGNLVLSCIQLGVGNCQRMVNSGRCSGFADSNGTTICAMADRIGGTGTTNPGTGTGTGSGPGTGSGTTPWTGGYTPEPPCKRDVNGGCLPISAALSQGFTNGSGVTMEALKNVLFGLAVGIVLLIMGSSATGTWGEYSRGAITKPELMLNMKRIALVVLVFVMIMSYV